MKKQKSVSSHIDETTTSPRLKSTEKRDEIVREAYNVFYSEGFLSSGVDRVLQGTGISKRTLYKYFASKEDLIEATIAHYRDESLLNFEAYLKRARVTSPEDRLLLAFDWLEEMKKRPDKFGCFAMNAKIEFATKEPRIAEACDSYFAHFGKTLLDLCRECKLKNAKRTANQLHILFRGAIINEQLKPEPGSIQDAKAVARLIIENAR